MQQIMAKFGAQDGANVIDTDNDQIDSDEAFKQRVIASLDALVTGQGDVKAVVANSDVVNAVKSNTKKTSQYSQMMGISINILKSLRRLFFYIVKIKQGWRYNCLF